MVVSRINRTRTQVRSDLEYAGMRLFAQKGFAKTTVDEIVDAAGVSKPILYRHFESKKGLYLDLLETHRKDLAAAALLPFQQGQGGLEARLIAMIEAWFGHIETQPMVGQLLFRSVSTDPDIEAAHKRIQAALRSHDEAWLRAALPDLPEAQRQPLAEVLRASLTGLTLWWLDHPEISKDVLVAVMTRVSRGLLP